MKVQFLLVPYDSGRREWRMGRGPSYLLRHGVGSGVRALGHEVDAEYVDAAPTETTEIATSFSLYRQVAERAREARRRGALPIVLGGNCGVTLGAVAGVGDVGVLWLDAHADFNTPETTRSGFLDGMALAALTGRCWRTMTASIPGFVAMPETNVVLAGARDLDPAEEELLAESEVTVVRGQTAIAPALEALRERVSRLHFHLDADVLDGAANAFAAPNGLTSQELVEIARLAAGRFEIVSITVSAYDPEIDAEGAIPPAIAAALEVIIR
jgi:arginase